MEKFIDKYGHIHLSAYSCDAHGRYRDSRNRKGLAHSSIYMVIDKDANLTEEQLERIQNDIQIGSQKNLDNFFEEEDAKRGGHTLPEKKLLDLEYNSNRAKLVGHALIEDK